MKILDTNIIFNFYDAEQMEKFEKYADIAKKELNNLDIENKKQSDFIKEVCFIIENCFNSIFGENMSKEIFKGKKDFQLCVKAFKDLWNARKEQEELIANEILGFQEEIQKASEKYSPNRAKR